MEVEDVDPPLEAGLDVIVLACPDEVDVDPPLEAGLDVIELDCPDEVVVVLPPPNIDMSTAASTPGLEELP